MASAYRDGAGPVKRRWLIIAVLLMLVGAGLVVVAVSTEPGLRFTLRLANALVPGTLTVNTVEGRLIGPLSVTGLRYRDDAVQIEIDQVALAWLPRRLLSGSVHLQRLAVDGLRVTVPKDDAPSPAAVSLPEVTLPVAVVVESMRLQDLRIVTGADAIAIDMLSLGGHAQKSLVELESFALRWEAIELTAVASVDLRDDYPLEAELDWKIRIPEQPAIDGTTRLSGSLTLLGFEQEVRGAIDARHEGTVQNLLAEPSWNTQVSIDHVAIAAWMPEWHTASATGTFSSRGTLQASELEGELRADLPVSGPLHAELAVQVTPDEIQVRALDLTQTHTGAATTLAGVWQPGEDMGTVDLTAHWRDVTWPFVGAPQVRSDEGRMHLSGGLDQYSVTVESVFAGKDLPDSHVTGRGIGTRDLLALEAIELRTLDGRLAGAGELRWAPTLVWDFTLHFSDLNPGVHWPEWDGQLAGKGWTRGQSGAEGLAVDAGLEDLAGALRGYPVTAKSRLRLVDEHVEVLEIAATSGDATLDASGSITDHWDLRWHLDAPDLAALTPRTSGQATLSGTVGGPRTAPHIRASTASQDLRVPELAIGELSGDIDVDLAKGQRFQVDIQARQLALVGRRWDSATVLSEGTPERHRLTARLDSADDEIVVAVAGSTTEAREWDGILERADVAVAPWGRWSLAAPAALRLGGDRTRIAPLCWTQNGARLCAEAAQQDGGWVAKTQVQSLPVTQLEPWLPEQLNLAGEVNGEAGFTLAADQRLTGRAEFKAVRGSVQFPVAEGTHTLSFDEVGVNASIDERGLLATVGIPFEDGSAIRARLELPRWQPGAVVPEQQPVSGDIQVAFRALQIVALFVPDLANVQGSLDADLALGGTLADPTIAGRAELNEGRMEVPRLGVAFEEVTLTVEGDPQRTLRYRAGARSGEGQLSIEGETQLAPAAGWPTSVRITGTDFMVADIPEALVLVSPELELRMRGRRIDLDGELRVPRARLLPKQLPEGTVSVSRDVVVVGREAPARPPAEEQWALYSKVRVILGERVNFDGFGLRGRLSGNLLVIDEPNRLTLGRGEFGISDGVYQAYGQNLTIERGRLIYANNPIDNPGLDVSAIREVDTVTAGLRVSGTLQEPTVRLFSDPAMSDSEILSYLVLGRPLNQASSGEGADLMSAATALALAGGDSLARNIGASMGLEEIRVEATEAEGDDNRQGARVVLGRYLSPRLYVRYFAGLFEATDLVQLQYSLTRSIKIQTEAGVDRTGADVFWTFER